MNTAGAYESETHGGAAKVGTDVDKSRIGRSVYKDLRAEWTATRFLTQELQRVIGRLSQVGRARSTTKVTH